MYITELKKSMFMFYMIHLWVRTKLHSSENLHKQQFVNKIHLIPLYHWEMFGLFFEALLNDLV